MRKIVIGDIHGCNVALSTLIDAINVDKDDTIITLGDYIDRGENSKEVIYQLIGLKEKCDYISLLGNHELMLMRAFNGNDDLRFWLKYGGYATMFSYGLSGSYVNRDSLKIINRDHISFIYDCKHYHEDDNNIFVHANYDYDKPMDKQSEDASFWRHLNNTPEVHISGKKFWVGHTPQESGNLLDMGHIICIDTYCFDCSGWLTAVEVNSQKIWQANNLGVLREPNWP